MVDLVPLLQAPQDRDRVFDRRLVDVDRLESPFQSRVLFDVLLVLVQGRGADGAQLAAGERGLQHVGGVHRPFRGAGSDQRVQLVDEKDDRALRFLDLLQDRLQPVFEFPPVFGAGDHGAQVERDDTLVLQPFGNVAHVNAAGEPFDDRRLADAGLPDQHRVVLGAARKDLDHAPDFLVPADDRIDLSAAGQVGQIPRVPLQGLVFVLRVRIRDASRAANLFQRFQQRVFLRSRLLETLRGLTRVGLRQGD